MITRIFYFSSQQGETRTRTFTFHPLATDWVLLAIEGMASDGFYFTHSLGV